MNKVKQILLLFIALFAISLTAFFSVGLFVAHKLAVSSKTNSNETKKIVLTSKEFFALTKTTLSNNVFEIEYQDEEYDVFKTEFILSKSQVILWIKKDGFENKIRKFNSIVFNTNTSNNNTIKTQFVLFNFYFFEDLNSFVFKANNIKVSNHFRFDSKSCNVFLENENPPPQQV